MFFRRDLHYCLTHQCGKVGSQTVEQAVRHAAPTHTGIARLHYLSEDHLARLTSLSRLPGSDPGIASAVQAQVDEARCVRDVLDRLYGKHVWVLTGVRDPLDQAVSAFFQNLPVYCPWLDYRPENAKRAADQLQAFFNQQFDRMLTGKPPETLADALLDLKLAGPEPWFDHEFTNFHGVSVYDKRMRASQGLFCLKKDNVNFLIYKSEHLSQSLPPLLRKMGLKQNGPIASTNVGQEKEYSLIYAAFKNNFKPATHVTDYYYGGRYYRHFYEARFS